MDVEIERAPNPRVAGAGERADVAGEVDGGRPHLARERRQFPLGPPASHDQSAAALAQRRVEVGEALEQELRPRTGGVATVQKAVVEAEHRNERVGAGAGRLERRVVVDPQVPAEPENGAHRWWIR